MEKENVILNDDELKDVAGGGTAWNNMKVCNKFPRKDVCEKYGDGCIWHETSQKCIAK